MADDKSKVGEPDRSRVAADQDHEVSHLAETPSISSEHARKLIERCGDDQDKIYAAVETLKLGWVV